MSTQLPDTENLIVEFVVPHYFGSLFTVAADAGADDFFGGEVICREYGRYLGDVRVYENPNGAWMVSVSDNGTTIFTTHIENVERIVVV